MRAVWNGEVIADSDDTVVVEGNHYFPMDAVWTYPTPMRAAAQITDRVAFWKGVDVLE